MDEQIFYIFYNNNYLYNYYKYTNIFNWVQCLKYSLMIIMDTIKFIWENSFLYSHLNYLLNKVGCNCNIPETKTK